MVRKLFNGVLLTAMMLAGCAKTDLICSINGRVFHNGPGRYFINEHAIRVYKESTKEITVILLSAGDTVYCHKKQREKK